MRIDSSNYSMQRNGGLLNNKRSPEVIRENLKKVRLTEEDWQEIYRQVNAPKPAEVAIPQKSMGSVLKDVMAIPSKIKQHFKDEKQKRIAELMKTPYEPGLHD